MNTPDVSAEDVALVRAASTVIAARHDPERHVVGAALRLVSGEVVTGVHLEATVGRVAVCAEAVAIGRAVTEYGSAAIETIVAVYHPQGGEPYVCSPCGMCRELIADYAPEAAVLLLDDHGALCRCSVRELLPRKYRPR